MGSFITNEDFEDFENLFQRKRNIIEFKNLYNYTIIILYLFILSCVIFGIVLFNNYLIEKN